MASLPNGDLETAPAAVTGNRAVEGRNEANIGSKEDEDVAQAPYAPTNSSGSRRVKGVAWILVVVALISAIFLFALDNTVVADVQPQVLRTLNEIEKLPWISVAFSLGAISVTLLWGKLFGQFDGKILFLGGVLLFEVGSALCGAAPTMNALIVGRMICGVGGAGIYIGAMNLLSVLTTESERPAYLGLVGLTWGLGTVLGPIIGGAFADSSATWRWAFYINLCVGAAAAPVYLLLLPASNPRPGVKIQARLSELDVVGTVLTAGALVSGVMAIAFGGATYAWNSGQTIGLFVCSGILWILFGVQQTWCIFTSETHRLFPVQFLRSYELCILFAQTATSITAGMVSIYFISLFFQFVRDDSALEAGVRLLPFVMIMVSAIICNGVVMGKTGYYMPWYLAGGILIVVGGTLLHTVDLDSSTGKIYGYSVITALGTGLFSQASFPVAQGKVAPILVPSAVAFISFAQISGITIALTVANSIFLNESSNKISAILPGVPLATVHQAISGADGTFLQTLSDADRTDVLNAIVSSISNIYIMVITAGALAVVLSVFMKREKLFLEQGTTTDA